MNPPPATPASGRQIPRIRAIGKDAVAVVIDLPGQTNPRIERVAGGSIAPLATLRLPLADGGTRALWGVRLASLAGGLRLYPGAVAAPREIQPPKDAVARANGSWLLEGLAPAERINLVSALLGVWAGVLKLRHDPVFAALANQLALQLAAEPSPAKIVAALADGRKVATTWLAARLGEARAAYRIAAETVEPMLGKPHLGEAVRGRRRAHLLAAAASGDVLVIVGEEGLAVRKLIAGAAMPALSRWWRAVPASDDVRSFLVGALAGVKDGSRAALEFQMAAPLRPRTVVGRGQMPSAQVNLAVSAGPDLVVGGWMRDPADLVAGVDLVDTGGKPRSIDEAWHRFAETTPDGPVTGFIARLDRAARPGPLLQPRLQLRLSSGARLPLTPEPQPLEPMERRSRVLRAVPPDHIDDAVLERTLGPALSALQAEIARNATVSHVEEIGSSRPKPAVSIIVPLYRVLDFLRAQYAAFANDPDLAPALDLVYVVDSPEQADDVVHLLRGLHLLYDLPVRVVVMRQNSGYALACNAGARLAEGRTLLLVNSDVIPARTGWAAPLAARIAPDSDVAAAGPKLLFEDDSVQHAGLYFDRDHGGRWLNHHFFKGLPRHFPAACVPRLVPAVTGACLAVRRDVFEAVGGFTEDYVIGDYEDSDLCLKVREAGFELAYVPGAELYHFERQSIRESADYVRGAAARHNAWLHERRWAEQMEALRETVAGASELARAAA